MATLSMHQFNRLFSGTLDAAITDVQTSIVLSGLTTLETTVEVPFYARCDSEWMEVTAYAAATPTADKATLTVVRGAKGTTAASHAISAVVKHGLGKWEFEEHADRLYATERAFTDAISADGVVREAAASVALKAVAYGTPGASAYVNAGAAIVSGQPVQIAAQASVGPFSAPSGNTRIDIVQIDQYGALSIKQGTLGGSAPSVDTACLLLAEVHLRSGNAVIKDTDDSTNGYIVDKREFA